MPSAWIYFQSDGDSLPLLAAIPGNHDWKTLDAQGYENYWLARQPPASRTPINTTATGPDRHHYMQPLGKGWLGIFIDCGPDATMALSPAALTEINCWITAHCVRNIVGRGYRCQRDNSTGTVLEPG